MDGEAIFARTISARGREKSAKQSWQYHPRSDVHSKVACWGIVFDLLQRCDLLRRHAADRKVALGINHEMRDFRVNRKKNLDIVICTPASALSEGSMLYLLGEKFQILLTDEERERLGKLPPLCIANPGRVLLALEAKACMTEHLKARPRLYDELSSSFQTVHGDTTDAIAAGHVIVNAADSFVSPIRNAGRRGDEVELTASPHVQPRAAEQVVSKIMELPRRSGPDGAGFDAIGISYVWCRNDGSEVRLVARPDGGRPIAPILTYSAMIERISGIYSTRFRSL